MSDVLKDFELQYEELPNPESKLYTVMLRRVGLGRDYFVQRIVRRKNTNKSNGKSKGFIK